LDQPLIIWNWQRNKKLKESGLRASQLFQIVCHTQNSSLNFNLLKTSQVEPSKPAALFQQPENGFNFHQSPLFQFVPKLTVEFPEGYPSYTH